MTYNIYLVPRTHAQNQMSMPNRQREIAERGRDRRAHALSQHFMWIVLALSFHHV